MSPKFVAYCDGACSGNPGPGGWGVLFYLPESKEIMERGGGVATSTTNNQMEIEAACQVFETISKKFGTIGSGIIFTDSKYVITGITTWINNWKRRGWINSEKKPVANKALWERLDKLHSQAEKIKWTFVEGHKGDLGNERVDEIAVAFSKQKIPELYEGPLSNYPLKNIF